MDSNSSQCNCVSCGNTTTSNVSFQPGELIHTCGNCGSVLKIEKVPGLFER